MVEHQDLLGKMTLEEKAAFLAGKTVWETWNFERLKIPSIFCADGPHGLRKQAGEGDHLGLNKSLPATCFPTAATIANSWDETLAETIGEALGREAVNQNVHILLGPGLNIKRNPLCGRNFEYFSEDPYLSGKMAAAYVRGIQKEGVYACPKHFAVNNQEWHRMTMNSVLDERALREIYLTGFEIAVKEGNAKALMTSYNRVNGVYANENRHLLQDILRGEWEYDGIVLTDWGGSNDPVQGVLAGSDLQMPGPDLDSARTLVTAVENGILPEETLDNCVDRLLHAVFELSEKRDKQKVSVNKQLHHKLARKAAQESAVLLKNEGHILPIKENTRVAVIGDFAFVPRYQGAGSSIVNPTYLDKFGSVIKEYDLQCAGLAKGYRRDGKKDEHLRKEALALAKDADIVLYCFGLDELSEVEGQDRGHMRLPQNQISLLQDLAQVNSSIIGILSAGAPVEMPWQECCQGLLHGYLNGQAGARAMLDILVGKVNPSGRLSETYPIRYEDTPSFQYFPGTESRTEYRESIYVGYRYYDTSKQKVRYPFGYGLSYTDFSYTDIQVTPAWVEITLTNTGKWNGAEVVQLYVSLPQANVFRPEKELKGFKKVYLKSGEQKRVRILFDDKTFRYWNVKTNQWEVESGKYLIRVGANIEDIRLETELQVVGTTKELPYDTKKMRHYQDGCISQIEDEEFETLLGYSRKEEEKTGELGLNDAVCQMNDAKSYLARFICCCLELMKRKNEKSGKPDLNLLFIYDIPFRGIAKMTGGMVSIEMVKGMLFMVNGHFFKGLHRVIKGYFVNAKENKNYLEKIDGRMDGGNRN